MCTFVSLFSSAHSICCIHGICRQRVGASAHHLETKGIKKPNKQTIKETGLELLSDITPSCGMYGIAMKTHLLCHYFLGLAGM